MEFKVSLPVNGTALAMGCSLDSLIKQWKSSPEGAIRRGYIHQRKLVIEIGKYFEIGEEGYRGLSTQELSQRGNTYSIDLVGTTFEKISDLFRKIQKKIQELSKHKLMEFEIVEGEGFQFRIVESVWQQQVSSEQPSQQRPAVNSLPANEKKGKDVLLLIDGMNLINRSYHGSAYKKEESELLRSSKGVFTNGVKTFVIKLLNVLRTFDPTHVAVLWDPEGGRNTLWRRQVAAYYKANRDETVQPVPLKEQIITCKDVLSAMCIPQYEVPTMEADDLIGSLAKRWSNEGMGTCYMWSNDNDYFQLLDDNIIQLLKDKPFTVDDFKDEYDGIDPQLFIDYKGYTGDTSDNLKGVTGIGKVGALGLIKTYGAMSNAIAEAENGTLKKTCSRYRDKLITNKQVGEESKYLATILTDVPEMNSIKWDDLIKNIDRAGFKSMMNQLEINL
ncbi:hypothetical protein OM416_19165 [Paenibacillus sp. LS1]|uniref:5'-3' exonuclease n=1 Tax=Paenibacillus sp. LS1 TaxID=2992120 RepID=UPI00222F1A62|nr:5'-3' exonuclease H3TH domain-containing protein [Paenibacillus sp. LS1]MCW3793716.1 hypothetical protein [Paenibacillus sp. LS1]